MRSVLRLAILFFVGFVTLQAQDSIKLVSTLSVETKGAGILVDFQEAQNNIECISCVFETISDNPINHFAIYSGLTHRLTLNDKFKFETGIFLEERSFSGGSNTVDNWIAFPKILISGVDTFAFGSRKLQYKLMGGDLWNYDSDDILRIHNLDYQGLVGELKYQSLTVGFLIIGDLATNVQIGLHQMHKYYLKKEFGNITSTLFFNDNFLNYSHAKPRDFNLGNHTRIQISKNTHVQSQLEWRMNDVLGNSMAAGLEFKYEIKNLELNSRLKYYQSEFNLGYGTNRILSEGLKPYRGRSSYVGEQLYPLKNFFRDYSQWGNYTKLQGNDLIGLELNVLWEKKIWNNIHFMSDIDFHLIANPKTQTGRTIPLYSIGLRSKYFDFLKTEFYFTNKFMNLDSFYQTFQASRKAFFGGRVELDLEDLLIFEKKIPISKKKAS